LALQSEGWFTDRHVLEERMDSCQAVVSRPRAVATVEFEVFEESPQEGNVDILYEQFRRSPPEVLTAELEQEPKGISVSRYGILARTELL
jgi:hypothetical protein